MLEVASLVDLGFREDFPETDPQNFCKDRYGQLKIGANEMGYKERRPTAPQLSIRELSGKKFIVKIPLHRV